MSDAQLRAMRDLYAVIEQVRPQLDAAVRAVAANVPAFARLQAIDPAEREAQAAASRALERAALLDGEWEAYAAHLHEQGTPYGHMEVSFEDWFSPLRPYRQVSSRPGCCLSRSTPSGRRSRACISSSTGPWLLARRVREVLDAPPS